MKDYLYKWQVRTSPGLRVEVEVVASSAVVARRMFGRFLREQDGSVWLVESISRSTRTAVDADAMYSAPTSGIVGAPGGWLAR